MDAAEESLARQMYDASTTDPLTRVANRRHFGERLEAEVAYSARHRTPLHLVLFDIDHFKRVNDTHGHAAGDIVLRIVAAQVGRTIRAEDLLARYGGEEFAILVRGIPASHVATMAERVRASVQRLEIPLSSESLRVTISVGVASIPQPGEARSLLEVADERLYRAKHAGRNRVCVR
jgi:diguanylate cyclase (GGDEF)-like protein